jgi:hypothetical protein
MLGMFNINSIPATILFESRASHSFISQVFIREHSIPLVAMRNPMIVNSPGGTISASYFYPSASISLKGVDFSVSPVVLRTSGIDVILGMDWMKQHRAIIQCKEKVVSLTAPKVMGTVMGTGLPIFRQVQDNQRFVRRATHRSGFRSQRPKPCNLSTTSPLVINCVTIRLTSPRRLIPAANRKFNFDELPL